MKQTKKYSDMDIISGAEPLFRWSVITRLKWIELRTKYIFILQFIIILALILLLYK